MATQMELVQQQTRVRAALTMLPSISRRYTQTLVRHLDPPRQLHPAFQPRTPAPHRHRYPRVSTPHTETRRLTQTRFSLPERRPNLTSRSMISMIPISHHEHLARTYYESDISRCDRAFHQERTDSSPPQDLQYHEEPD